ncbi:MAG: methionyl-tRNA formyltransferase [Desulfobulbus propionicus]|nr:MAG: methionyl-tRNA formyltransferase [Desulfobulbus propionicus]
MRIVFMGTPDFAVPTLQALLDGPHQVAAVVCQPDRPKGRGRKLAKPPVKVLAEGAGLSILQPQTIRTPEFRDELASLHPDLLVVVAYGHILPGSLLDLPPLGALNVHGSLLPKYRGAAPIQWAIINGERQTGLTLMQMNEGMDTGDILLQESIPVSDEDTAGSVFQRLAALGGAMINDALNRLAAGELRPVPQDDSRATVAPMLAKETGRLNWNAPAATLHNLIRGLDPWPSAFTFLKETRFRLFTSAHVREISAQPPGTIISVDNRGLLISTGEGSLLVREIQAAGRRRMTIADCLNGLTLRPGDRFS